MHRFWTKFKQLVDEKMQSVQRKDFTQELLEETCPECGKQLNKRLGKQGHFIGCSGYPDCNYTRPLNDNEEAGETNAAAQVVEDRSCPSCGSPLHIKLGSRGKFIGCSTYPKCKYTESLEKPVDTGITCPDCGNGTLAKRKSRYGTFFYSCSTYPTCKYAISYEPVAEKCPTCGWPILMLKTTKRRGTEKICPQKECKYAQQIVLEEKSS